ncbi:DUF5060 domain-containing protein [Pelagicoccus mobilis]|uniref:mannan endo-1,4-beta-mannosidase n=1 Tax=Pelagicoccus mobilis TaxID=415221 RepID=A0A934RVY7_9BACT|nr:DUF5060 domain-containing protein [Pelagicoccus mobilis]MBK1877817.1 DUF5060 domain-containing protein [Pelagicoccus mobilis]
MFTAILALQSTNAKTVEFSFEIPADKENPFARDIWATIETPSGETVSIPCFYSAENEYSVRQRPSATGSYRLVDIWENRDDLRVTLPLPDTVAQQIHTLPHQKRIRIDPKNPRAFANTAGNRFVPFGGNIPWPPGADKLEDYYSTRFQQFNQAGLNLARVWMTHWGGMNLDWLPEDDATHPLPGQIDLSIADRMDTVVQLAEEANVYIQLVFQYHGQYSTETNSNWAENPWNAANPDGFLKSPADFFTSDKARQLTRLKYRYIIARWGYSPAIMAWELFNEVHWVDALRFDENEAGVADWHREMAGYIRSIDVHEHLVTTSIENVFSPVNDSMDYLQPHIYGIDMINNMLYLHPDFEQLEKPVFFGEYGDDHMVLPEGTKHTDLAVMLPMWAGVMGQLQLPSLPWFTNELIEAGRLSELHALGSFIESTRLAHRDELIPFSPALSSDAKLPFNPTPGFVWMHRPICEIPLKLDGGNSPELAYFPGVLINDPLSLRRGFPQSVSFEVKLEGPARFRIPVRINSDLKFGATAVLQINGRTVETHKWDVLGRHDTFLFEFELPAGKQVVELSNDGVGNYFHVDGLETEFQIPTLGAAGKRSEDFIAIWFWHRENAFAVDLKPAATATLELEDLAAGNWLIEHWNTVNGEIESTTAVDHKGGSLFLETPPISSHGAMVLKHLSEP